MTEKAPILNADRTDRIRVNGDDRASVVCFAV